MSLRGKLTFQLDNKFYEQESFVKLNNTFYKLKKLIIARNLMTYFNYIAWRYSLDSK